MKAALIACAAAAALLAGAFADDTKTPAQWVTQLGADNLQDREAASTALLGLGSKARDAVRQGLDSTDPEVQARAKELWKTLRWLVVPDADEDVQKMVADAEKGPIDQSRWKDFVHNHGAESIRLVALFRTEQAPATSTPASQQPPPPEDESTSENLYVPGLLAVLEDVAPMEVARVIAQTDNSSDRNGLEALLDELPPTREDTPEKTAAHWMQIQIALWNYQKAFDFGRDYSFRTGSYDVAKQCAIAVDRGGLFDKIRDAAGKDVAAEADAGTLCTKLGFYTWLYTTLEKKQFIDPLFDLVQKTPLAGADDAPLRHLVESLLNAGMPERAVKVLHNVQSAAGLYMRSAADMQMQNEPAANADWSDAMSTLDSVDDAKKKEAFYDVGELMRDWHDERNVVLFQKVLSISPANTVYDANSSFRMGEYMEAHKQFAQAAEFYEQGAAIASKIAGGVMVATDQNGKSAGVGEQPVLEKIRQLKYEAAQQKSIFKDQPAAQGGNNDGPQ